MPVKFRGMKNIFKLMALVFACSVMVACDKETEEPEEEPKNENTNNNVTQGEYIKCKVDGVEFLSKDDEDNLFSYARIVFGQHHMKGADDTKQSINLYLWEFDGEGTYPVGGEKNASCQWLTVNPNATYDCNETLAKDGVTTGTIVVTKASETSIEGTFEFTAVNVGDQEDKVTVTDGEFKLNYK